MRVVTNKEGAIIITIERTALYGHNTRRVHVYGLMRHVITRQRTVTRETIIHTHSFARLRHDELLKSN